LLGQTSRVFQHLAVEFHKSFAHIYIICKSIDLLAIPVYLCALRIRIRDVITAFVVFSCLGFITS